MVDIDLLYCCHVILLLVHQEALIFFIMLYNNNNHHTMSVFLHVQYSSVTAGHDSFYNQSYPSIIHKRMSPILDKLGVELLANNIAQGANNCIPYQMCYEAMGGMDPDWVGWEQSYNCGHDEGVFELAARIAGWSKNKGVVYYSASGAWSPNQCPPSEDSPPYSDENWSVAKAGLAAWVPSANDIDEWKSELEKYSLASLSAKRFQTFNDRAHDYRAVSPHGFNVWESNRECKGRDKADTKDITNCNGIDAAQQCKMKFMSLEASLYGKEDGRGANWHPTRAFHMLRGEFITFLYSLALMDGIYELQSALEAKGDAKGIDPLVRESLKKEYISKLAALQPPLPEPKKCHGYHCDKRPICYTDYRPHHPRAEGSLMNVIVGRTNWTYEPELLGEWSLQYVIGYVYV